MFFDNWIKRSDTLDRQRAVGADTPWPFPFKASGNCQRPCKRFILFYRHDLFCLIMILPYSHSLSVQSVARNGYGYIRTMQRWNSCGLWQKPLNCLERFYRKGVCVIDNAVKTIQKKNGKCGIGNRGKTKIVVKEHFSEKGKTMEELLTDVMLEKAKQTIA